MANADSHNLVAAREELSEMAENNRDLRLRVQELEKDFLTANRELRAANVRCKIADAQLIAIFLTLTQGQVKPILVNTDYMLVKNCKLSTSPVVGSRNYTMWEIKQTNDDTEGSGDSVDADGKDGEEQGSNP